MNYKIILSFLIIFILFFNYAEFTIGTDEYIFSVFNIERDVFIKEGDNGYFYGHFYEHNCLITINILFIKKQIAMYY